MAKISKFFIVVLIFIYCAFSQHFEPIYEGNPFMPMSFYVTEAEINCVGLTDGDEIGVFDGDLCVGAGILESEIEPPFFSVVASKDDGDGNGFTEGNAISYKFWDYSEGEEIECVSVSYYDNYGEPAVVAVFSGLDDAAVKLAAVSTTPVHFTEWAETAENNLIKINLVELNNRPISEGDEIGIFCPTENGNSQILCGASVWNSSCIIEIIVWEDDTSLTPGEQDGYVCGEEIIIKIWYRCIDQEEQMLVVDEEGDGTFCSGLFGDVNAVNLSGYGPPENTSPIADAGGNQNFHLGNPFDSVLVELDGGNSYDCDGELTDWQWNWDEKTSNELVVSAYFGMGNHRAILRVTDDENAISLDSCEIFITSAPHASFSAGQTEGYAPLTVEFTNTSNLGTGDLISYSWHFGDGETSDEENPTHVFLSADTFYVSLTVSTTNGTDISEYTTITVIEPIQPIATFIAEPDSGYAPLEVVFTNTSNLGTGELSHYLWRFGDGIISTEANPTHVYEESGEFEARLKIATTHGSDSSFVIIYVLGTVGIEDNLAIPEDYFLRCNYPNPFNATTAVEFGFPEQSQCSIVIYDLSGRKISVLADAEFDPGVYQIRWDGKNSAFQDAPSGIYFYSLHAEKFHKTGKMILLR